MGKYVSYILKRVILAILSIIIVSAITFFVMELIPGGPFNKEKATSAEAQKVLEQRYNLDKPVLQQYAIYMSNIVKGDWGVSLKTGREIWPDITSKFYVSAKLGLMAAVLAIIFGIILGSIAALTRNRWPDRTIVFLTTLGTAMPSFVLATLLLLVFCMKLGMFPVWSANNPNYTLPIIALCVYPTAYITRLTKTSMLDALNQDFIRTAKAKGVTQNKLIFVHALRNALIPVVTYVGPMIAYILTGSMVVENIFTIGGLGTAFVQSITNRDYTTIMAITIFLAILMVIANMLTDIAYKLIDPRINFE
ncbi:oligopeptide transport system permease protein [Lachnospiraceae bacterium C7]|nr:oligopeptide transport system permease protein [Lachnospiraceae bacterium C7]